jgi:hypothetical protein
MSSTAHKTLYVKSASFRGIIILSVWGFVLAVASFFFLWLGHLLDELLGTAPTFMLGLFFLGIIGCFIELYQEVLQIQKDT